MIAQEAAALCRFAKACCPQQKIDEYTPTAWFPLLNDIDFEEAKNALIEVVKRQPFVAPAEIRAEVFRTHRGAAFSLGHIIPPRELADLPHRENAWKRTLRAAVVDGCDEARAIKVANASQGITPDDEPLALEAGESAVAAMKAFSIETALAKSLARMDAKTERDAKAEAYRLAKAERPEESNG